jgi:hypothetical protein
MALCAFFESIFTAEAQRTLRKDSTKGSFDTNEDLFYGF